MNSPERNAAAHTASRLVPAASDVVYQALVRPESLVQWLPPAGATGRIDVMEPRPGGRFRMTLTFAAPTGKSSETTDVVNGSFVELVPNKRLVQAITFESADPAFAGVMTMTWRLAPRPGGTKVTVSAQDVPDGISREEHEQGMASTLDNLAAFLGH